MDDIKNALRDIRATADPLAKALKLAGLVTTAFREAGWELVVVGGSAVEFYTEGAYMSGDIDVCRKSVRPIPLRTAQDLMARLEATGGPRSWLVAGMYVDLLGPVENEAKTAYRSLTTPYGAVQMLPVELVIVEWVLRAFYPAPDGEARNVAKKLLSVCLTGATSVDWAEVKRLSALPDFQVTRELNEIRAEVKRECRSKG
jgi:zona occludens toxin (predicted ATPase)